MSGYSLRALKGSLVHAQIGVYDILSEIPFYASWVSCLNGARGSPARALSVAFVIGWSQVEGATAKKHLGLLPSRRLWDLVDRSAGARLWRCTQIFPIGAEIGQQLL